MQSINEVSISSPSAPSDIANAIFNSCSGDESAVASVFQQELIIACADLITQKNDSFNGVLVIRLAWYTEAIDMLLEFISENVLLRAKNDKEQVEKFANLLSLLGPSFPDSVLKKIKNSNEKVIAFDLPPTAIKEILAALMSETNWHLLTPRQVKRLNGALNRVPMNLYDRVWNVLERVRGGILIAGQHLPQDPTLKVMTQFELNFSYRIESMMSKIGHPEYRQLLVELLCILATLMERNPEIYFDEAIDCDQLIKRAFAIFSEERGLIPAGNLRHPNVDMTSFYQLDEGNLGSSTTAYLIRAVVDKLLLDSNIQKQKFHIHEKIWKGSTTSSINASDEAIERSNDTCRVS